MREFNREETGDGRFWGEMGAISEGVSKLWKRHFWESEFGQKKKSLKSWREERVERTVRGSYRVFGQKREPEEPKKLWEKELRKVMKEDENLLILGGPEEHLQVWFVCGFLINPSSLSLLFLLLGHYLFVWFGITKNSCRSCYIYINIYIYIYIYIVG